MKKLLADVISQEININPTAYQLAMAEQYLQAVWQANDYLNLTSARTQEELIFKHFIDSLYLIKYYKPEPETTLLDLGTGAGFPGVPLKIFLEDMELYFVDAVRRKINFLKYTMHEMKLGGTFCLHARAEDLGNNLQYRERLMWVVTRALGDLELNLELGMPLLKVGGNLVLYKGPKGEKELQEGAESISHFGGEIKEEIEYLLPGGEQRRLFIIKKRGNTPGKYPRKKKKSKHKG